MKTIFAYNRSKARKTLTPVCNVETKDQKGRNLFLCREVLHRGNPTEALAVLIPEEGDEVSVLCFGISRCHDNDTFSKKEGRDLALKRANEIHGILRSNPRKTRDSFYFRHNQLFGHAPVGMLEDVLSFFQKYSRVVRNEKRAAKLFASMQTLFSLLSPEVKEKIVAGLLGNITAEEKKSFRDQLPAHILQLMPREIRDALN